MQRKFRSGRERDRAGHMKFGFLQQICGMKDGLDDVHYLQCSMFNVQCSKWLISALDKRSGKEVQWVRGGIRILEESSSRHWCVHSITIHRSHVDAYPVPRVIFMRGLLRLVGSFLVLLAGHIAWRFPQNSPMGYGLSCVRSVRNISDINVNSKRI